jgi:alcohol dehydrogenase (cytochrome c)
VEPARAYPLQYRPRSTTAGGLAFVGDWDRHFYAHDAQTGELLWQTRTPVSAQGFPITYSVRGRQYLAVPRSGRRQLDVADSNRADAEIKRPSGGNAILVFALPEARRYPRGALCSVRP